MIEIDNYIGRLCNYGDELNRLTEAQKTFRFNQNLEREVNNGGFHQYFFNSSGDFAHETVASLLAIGATKTAALLRGAIDQFPEGKVPKDRGERWEAQERVEDVANEIWNQLDKKFDEYEEDLNGLNIEFIRKNREGF